MTNSNPFTNSRSTQQTRVQSVPPGAVSAAQAQASQDHAEQIHAEVNAERGEDAPTRGPLTVLKGAAPFDMDARVKALEAQGCPPKFAKDLAEQERSNAASASAIKVAVSAKGGVSVYGLGRWPVTLYASQWTRLLDCADAIRGFMAENAGSLATKG